MSDKIKPCDRCTLGSEIEGLSGIMSGIIAAMEVHRDTIATRYAELSDRYAATEGTVSPAERADIDQNYALQVNKKLTLRE